MTDIHDPLANEVDGPRTSVVRVWCSYRPGVDAVDVFIVRYDLNASPPRQWYYQDGQWWRYQELEPIEPAVSLQAARIALQDVEDDVRKVLVRLAADIFPTVTVQ